MARFVQAFTNPLLTNRTAGSTTVNGLITQVNTALAALVNPTIRQFSFQAYRPQRKLQTEFILDLSYDDGGAALATPFTLSVIRAATMPALATAVQTFLTANPTSFITGGRLFANDADDALLQAYYDVRLVNATAGASANYVPL